MGLHRPRRGGTAERARSPLWRWPVIGSVVGFVGGLLVTRIRPERTSKASWIWFGDVDSANALLQTVSTAVMTATTLSFSLTVVALQLASQQFSPRLLREFARDPVAKRVVTVLTVTFVFSTTSLYGSRADAAVPVFSIGTSLAFGLASVIAIVAFISHMAKVLRVSTMMLIVHDDTTRAIEKFYPARDDREGTRWDTHDPSTALVVSAHRSGFLQRIDVVALVRTAEEHDVVVHLIIRAGDQIIRGTPVALVWRSGGVAVTDEEGAVTDAVTDAVIIGYERTLDQDVAFGFRQLEDIAVKAMSPAINDPVTAANAVGHMADLLVRLTGCRLGPTMHSDADGVGRALVPDRDFAYYLDLCCGQLRRFGSHEPTILMALLEMLRDVAANCVDEQQRTETRKAAAEVVDTMSNDVPEADAESVREVLTRVHQVLDGDVVAAFVDRAGETRSM